MTVRAKDNKVLRIIIFPIAIEVCDFQHVGNAEAAMSAKWPINFEGHFAVIIRFLHWIELMSLLFLLTPNATDDLPRSGLVDPLVRRPYAVQAGTVRISGSLDPSRKAFGALSLIRLLVLGDRGCVSAVPIHDPFVYSASPLSTTL